MNANSIRHIKEKTYFSIAMIAGGFVWLLLLIGTVGTILIFGLIFALIVWLSGLYFQAVIYGDSVNVTPKQYPEIYNILSEQSQKLGISKPELFIYNGNGMMNALAVKFLSKKHIILMSDLVDLMLERNQIDELSFIIGHELGHHFAGHTSTWKNLLIAPSKIIPFLGAAYSRACELTADRVGYVLVDSLESSQKALVALALGSKSLANKTNLSEFISQERKIPTLMGFIHKLYSTHPRMTKRVIELDNFRK